LAAGREDRRGRFAVLGWLAGPANAVWLGQLAIRLHALAFEMQVGDLPTRGEEAQLGEAQQPLDRLGRRTEAVAQLLAKIVEALLAADARQPAVDFDLQPLARDVIARQEGGPGQIDRHFERRA